ncbi:MAG TPA: lysylphosphatidylglycerol synthase domain-containing protein, partial [Polyangiaceae bacterium]|nr:lysylphosphatidylglycerol synthase domain-containing protein [Polyangiaceae bacterium]
MNRKRLFSWFLAIAALSFVAWMVPVRDQCWDPGAPKSTRAAVTREAGGCVLHLKTGDVAIGAPACAQLKCEPGVVSTFAQLRVSLALGLFGLYVLAQLVWAARWRALLSFAGIDLPLFNVWRIITEAQAGGILLPGGVGGDALRVTAILARPTREGETRAPTSTVITS